MKKRLICLSVAITVFFVSIIGRTGYVALSRNYMVSGNYNSYSLTLESLYPTLYYSNGERINNNTEKYVAVLKPNERTLADLHNLFSSSEINAITNELKKGYPIIKEIDEKKKNNANYIDIYKVSGSEYVSDQLFSRVSSGLLKYVQPCKKRKISFHIDAMGRMLKGDEGKLSEEVVSSEQGINLTLNQEIESIANSAASKIKSGCVIVMNIDDSSILTCISKPDSSYINKPFEQYSVGSVFKIVVAACALENNVDFYYNCTSSTTVGDTTYSCQKNHIHGFENLKSALANSCNCYFVNLALKLGSDKLLKTARELGFEDEIEIYKDWKIKSACLPTESDLASKGELALLGFGQGKLSAAPLCICQTLCTIANGGMKNQVRFVDSIIDENANNHKHSYSEEERVLSEETSKTLLKYMRYVVTNGTGASAENSAHKSAGKTATAQTGQYFLGTEMLNTWFAGVYPFDNPKYAIVVMCENGKSGSEDCAPIYREIVEKLKNM